MGFAIYLVAIINNFLSNNDKLKSDEEEPKNKFIRQALNTLKYSLEDFINDSLQNFIEQLKEDLNKPL